MTYMDDVQPHSKQPIRLVVRLASHPNAAKDAARLEPPRESSYESQQASHQRVKVTRRVRPVRAESADPLAGLRAECYQHHATFWKDVSPRNTLDYLG